MKGKVTTPDFSFFSLAIKTFRLHGEGGKVWFCCLSIVKEEEECKEKKEGRCVIVHPDILLGFRFLS